MLLKKIVFAFVCYERRQKDTIVRQCRDVAEIEVTSLKQTFILFSHAINFIGKNTNALSQGCISAPVRVYEGITLHYLFKSQKSKYLKLVLVFLVL